MIKWIKTEKATGLDELLTEILKLFRDHNLKIIMKLFNGIYKYGIIPNKKMLTTIRT